MSRRNAVRLTAWLIGSLCLCGCGRKAPAPVAVKGRVQYANKEPVADMILTFHPLEDGNKSKLPAFLLNKEGWFQDSILPGRYKATLSPIPQGSGSGPAGAAAAGGKGPGASAAAGQLTRYQDRNLSPWEVVIPESGTDDLLLTVK